MRAPVRRMASPTFSGVRPPERAKGTWPHGLQRAPVERDAVAAGEDRTRRGLGVEQDEVGGVSIGERGGGVGRGRDLDRLHHGLAVAASDLAHPLRSFRPCSWNMSGFTTEAISSSSVSSASTTSATLAATPRMYSASGAACAGADGAGSADKDEADEVGATLDGGVERRLVLHSADLHSNRHRAARLPITT